MNTSPVHQLISSGSGIRLAHRDDVTSVGQRAMTINVLKSLPFFWWPYTKIAQSYWWWQQCLEGPQGEAFLLCQSSEKWYIKMMMVARMVQQVSQTSGCVKVHVQNRFCLWSISCWRADKWWSPISTACKPQLRWFKWTLQSSSAYLLQ